MMADYVSFKLTGMDDIVDKFRALPEQLRRKVVLPATKDAMQIVLDASINYAALIDNLKTPQSIASNIAMAERRKDGQDLQAVIMSVGVRKRRVKSGNNTFYWLWVELGTEHSKAHPFLRQPFNENASKIFREFCDSARYYYGKLGIR